MNLRIAAQYYYQIFVGYSSILEFSQFVLLADIEKTFLQVGIQESDRDVTHLLWFKDLTCLQSNRQKFECMDAYQFCLVTFGIICSPFLLAGIIKYHLKQISTSVALQIRT